MTERPTAAEAARALQDVDERRDQAFSSTQREARWVSVVFGIVIFLFLAIPDFLGQEAVSWSSWAFIATFITYGILQRTRRGASVLGRPTSVRKQEFSRQYFRNVLLVLLVLVLTVALAALVPDGLTVPYWRTGLGVVLGGTLIYFGPRSRDWLFTKTKSGRGGPGSVAHGSH
ncbi:hypothetical protein [Streptomyces iconiensis]|uniref:Uncharacterized protein n=1 Tax=Streptomyces iconiensis TaxID=1384038 RepID=A0ABT7A7C0_9ACTN|nr:hypothetical protein [Streptomyces iconiensis]MDJ1137219.1 hypothetical protein [Streptomyces iconiensis]